MVRVWHRYTMGQDFPHCTHICVGSWQCLTKLTYINYKNYYYYYNCYWEGYYEMVAVLLSEKLNK